MASNNWGPLGKMEGQVRKNSKKRNQIVKRPLTIFRQLMWRALPLSFLPAWAQPWSVIWWQALLIYDVKIFFSKSFFFRSAWPPFLSWWTTSHRYRWRRRTWSHSRPSSLWAPWHSVSVPRWCLPVCQTYTSTHQLYTLATGLPSSPPFPLSRLILWLFF